MILTPEKSIQLQLGFGADVLFCLDDCTHVDAPFEEQQLSVQRTIAWAKRCKDTFEKQLTARQISPEDRPLLFAVIQGGGYPELRKRCAEALLEIGFDGFGFGGWPLDDQSQLLTDIPGVYSRAHSNQYSRFMRLALVIHSTFPLVII